MMSKQRFLAAILVLTSAVSTAYAQFTGPAPLAWRWQQSATNAPAGSPAVDPSQADVVYVACGQRVYALGRTDGNQKWRYPAGEPLASDFKGTPVLVAGMVLVAAGNNTLYALDQATGEQKWTYVSTSPIVGNIVTNGKVAVFSQSDRELMAVNLADGTPFYSNADGTPNPLTIQDGISGKIAMWNDGILVMSGGRTLMSINVASRRTTWHVDFDGLGADSQPILSKTAVYITSGSYLIGLGAGTGRTMFQKDAGSELAFSPAVSDDGICVVTKDGLVLVYDLLGKQINKTPIDLGSQPFTSPTALPGGLYAIPTSNGSVNLISPTAGLLWDYPVRPIGGVQEVSSTTRGQGGKGGGPGLGGPGAGVGGPGGGDGGLGGQGLGGQGLGGGSGPGGTGGPGGNGQRNRAPQKIYTIQAAGPAILAGQTLLMLGRDGSLLAWDKTLGVDLTAPTVKMTFPNPGDQVNPNPPLELVFQIEDEASGVNLSTLKVLVDGVSEDYEFTPDGYAVVKFSSLGKNKPMRDGRHKIQVLVSDWMGNARKEEFVLTADNNLPLTILPGTQTNKRGQGGPGGPGGGAGGGGFGKGG